MNQNVIRTATFAAVLTLASTAGFAQNNARQNQNQRTTNRANQEATKEDLKVSHDELKKEVTDAHKASKIIGMEVRNTRNEEVGTVKDVVLDVQSGKIAYAVLSVGGLFGAGDKLVALPLESLTPQPGGDYFVIDADKDRLSQSAGFNAEDWPNLDAVKSKTIGLRPEENQNTRTTTPMPRRP